MLTRRLPLDFFLFAVKMIRKLCLAALLSCWVRSLGAAGNSKLPPYLKVCHQSDPELNKCVRRSVEQLRPLLVKGIPEFNIPSLEPLHIPQIVIDQGSGPVSVKSTYSNIRVYGPSQFTLKSVKIDLIKDRVRIKLFLPILQVESNYTLDGRILMMPISGSGEGYGNYSNIDATITMQGQRIDKDGETYFHIKDFYVDFVLGHASIELRNLFNGDEQLGESMNSFLNDNWESVANEIKPVLEDTIAAIFKRLANKIFHKYPIDVLLPE